MVHFAEINLVPFPWQSSDTEDCAKKLSQILPNNIDNVGKKIYLRIYMRYCLKKLVTNKKVSGRTWHFFSLNSLF